MSAEGGHWDPRGRPERLERLEASILAELQRPVAAPEVTGTVMARLGFTPADPQAARRWPQRRWVGRTLAAVGVLVVVNLGLRLHDVGPRARRPVGLTIPAAIGQDIHRYQRRIDRVLKSLRGWAPRSQTEPVAGPPVPEPETAQPIPESVDLSAIAPYRWV